MLRQEFVEQNADYVKNLVSGTGIFPETLFAQSIVESSDNFGNFGASTLAKTYNNYFGIKSTPDWKGKSINMQTGEFTGTPQAETINAYFRAYDSPQDSMQDYVNFLQKNSRYKTAGVFDATSPQDQANKLVVAGYATGKNYATLIGSVASDVSRWLGNLVATVVPVGTVMQDGTTTTAPTTVQKLPTYESETSIQLETVLYKSPVMVGFGVIVITGSIILGAIALHRYFKNRNTLPS